MRASTILLLGASSVSAVPLFLRAPSTLISTITSRDSTDNDNKNNNQIPLAGIIIGSIFITALLLCLIAYLVSHDNCITRRGWFKRRREQKNKGKSQYLSPQEDEEALTKRASFASERESIMFSRSRASSFTFAVVEDVDHSQRRMSSQTEAEQRKGLLSGHGNEMAEVDIASSSLDQSDRASLTSIPVIVSPSLENTHTDQPHDYMSRTGRSNRSEAVADVSVFREILPDDPRTHA
ncbi:hypothetical protein PMAA_044420 [Talaromyces marneffei ATCC 18224]|uniref:Uncharacterized protein n=1 Tax=Talaromyces marneffei (strain ATCC 18224 / CBS 334.59 / QM 7333) TaxID=441960 RepID=B6QS35_TALMQ|nr:hypothetical protein PMAA_044420 [Talaromyces marneffei ATCC 18224]